MFRIGVRLGLQNPGFRFFTVLSFTRDPRGGRERGGRQEPGLAPSSGLGDGVAPSGSGKEGYLKVAPAEFRDGNVCEGDLWTHGGRSPAATQGQAAELYKARRGVATRRVPFISPQGTLGPRHPPPLPVPVRGDHRAAGGAPGLRQSTREARSADVSSAQAPPTPPTPPHARPLQPVTGCQVRREAGWAPGAAI